jgi:hypothetical protein
MGMLGGTLSKFVRHAAFIYMRLTTLDRWVPNKGKC